MELLWLKLIVFQNLFVTASKKGEHQKKRSRGKGKTCPNSQRIGRERKTWTPTKEKALIRNEDWWVLSDLLFVLVVSSLMNFCEKRYDHLFV